MQPALPTLAQLINSPDEEVLADAQAGGVRFSRVDGVDHTMPMPRLIRRAVIVRAGAGPSPAATGRTRDPGRDPEIGVCRKLVELLMHPSPSVQTPALRTVGNIVTGNESQTQTVIRSVPESTRALGSFEEGHGRRHVGAISNITAGNKDQIQSTIDANVIPPLVKLLKSAEFDIKKGGAWAICS